MKPADKLKVLRTEIDRADRALLNALKSRMRTVKKIGELKRALGLPVFQKARWQQVLSDRRAAGEKVGLTSALIDDVYRAIHKEALRLQRLVKERK